MQKPELIILLLVVIVFIAAIIIYPPKVLEPLNVVATCSLNPEQSRIDLPIPDFQGKSLETAIKDRTTVTEYSSESLSLKEVSMLLWAGNGITGDESSFRSVPSLGSLNPIDIYMIPNRVDNASCGVYKYLYGNHEMILVKSGEFSSQLSSIAANQSYLKNTAAVFVLVAVQKRTTNVYGEEGKSHILLETGHIVQNMLLEATSLNLSSAPIAVFGKNKTVDLLGLDKEKNEAVYLIAVGKKR